MQVRLTGTARIEHAQTGEIHEVSADDLTYRALAPPKAGQEAKGHFEAVVNHARLGALRWDIRYALARNDLRVTPDIGNHALVEGFTTTIVPDKPDGTAAQNAASETARQHLAWLLEGVAVWNAKRERDDFQPQLTDIDIRGAFEAAGKLDRYERFDLEGAYLVGADLRGANLRGANLGKANLGKANLEGADLGKANLEGADLEGADLEGAILGGANLRGADLGKADLRGAILGGAILGGANLGKANVKSVLGTNNDDKTDFTNLSNTVALTQAQLDSMDGDSGTIIPNRLTCPAHWPDIDPSPLVPEPVQPSPFFFLSGAGGDAVRVQPLQNFLRQEGLPIFGEVNNAAAATAVLVIWTGNSVEERDVIASARAAQSAGRLVHVRFDDIPVPRGFSETPHIDLTGWEQDTSRHPGIRKLLQALRDRLDPPGRDETVERIDLSSPVTLEVRDGKLSPVDTPPNTPPAVINPEDRDIRLEGLRRSVATVKERVGGRDASKQYGDIYPCLTGIERALPLKDPIWYTLEDSKLALIWYLEYDPLAEGLNEGVVQSLRQILRRIDELQPLMQPRQVPPEEPEAKPPAPDALIRPDQVPEVADIATEVEKLLPTEAAKETLNPDAIDAFQIFIDHIRDAAAETNEEHRLPRLRRALRGLAWLTTHIGKVTTTVIVGAAGSAGGAILVNAEAMATFRSMMQPVQEMVIRFFM